MMYFLIMGVLVLSSCLALGWALYRLIGWGLAWIWPQRLLSPASSSKARKANAGKEKAAKSSDVKNKMTKSAARPWQLTQQLAVFSDFLPLGILAMLLYGGARLAAHGMASVDQAVPVGFSQIISVLGWAAVLLLALSAVGQWASWRCRRV